MCNRNALSLNVNDVILETSDKLCPYIFYVMGVLVITIIVIFVSS